MSDNVISLAERLTGNKDSAPIERKPKDYLACQHPRTLIDEVLRTVSCRDCAEDRLDPIEVLLGLARQWDRWQYEYKALVDLRRKQADDERSRWERSRDRHLAANPDHALDVLRTVWYGREGCRICRSLELRVPAAVRDEERQRRAWDKNKLEPKS